LWGDTVNIASRLTDDAAEGVIQVDKTTYNRIKNSFAFEPPSSIPMKGKGDVLMYRLTARLDNALSAGAAK
jgi:adenylate cyclase